MYMYVREWLCFMRVVNDRNLGWESDEEEGGRSKGRLAWPADKNKAALRGFLGFLASFFSPCVRLWECLYCGSCGVMIIQME